MAEAPRTGEVLDKLRDDIDQAHGNGAEGDATTPEFATDGLAGPLGKVHPLGVVAALLGVTGIVAQLIGTDYLIGNLRWWHWLLILATIGASLSFPLLNKIRTGIESISTFMLKGLQVRLRTGAVVSLIAAVIALLVVAARYDSEAGITAAFGIGFAVAAVLMGPIWVLSWAVFVIALFSSLTRYTAKFVEADLIIAEVSSLGWQAFALIAMLGIGYGVREGVNPRIDFWWAEFSNKKKAWLDFVLHVAFLLPFLLMVGRILYPFAKNTLGFKPDRSGQGLPGRWPSGWRVWETWEQQGDAGQLPVGPIQAMLFVAFILFTLQILAEVIKHGFTLIDREDLSDTMTADAPLRVE